MPTRKDPGKASGTQSRATGILRRGGVGVMRMGLPDAPVLLATLEGLRDFSSRCLETGRGENRCMH